MSACGFTARRSPRHSIAPPTRTTGCPGSRPTARTERFGPEPARPAAGAAWFNAGGARLDAEQLSGKAGSLGWELSWTDTGTPLWTFPRVAWERELLPAAQVVVAPTADFTGSLTIGDTAHRVDGWRGGVAHIYGPDLSDIQGANTIQHAIVLNDGDTQVGPVS